MRIGRRLSATRISRASIASSSPVWCFFHKIFPTSRQTVDLLAEREGLLGLRPRPTGRRRFAPMFCASEQRWLVEPSMFSKISMPYNAIVSRSCLNPHFSPGGFNFLLRTE